MRPRKVVVLVDANEQRLSERALTLYLWNYRVIRCETAMAALEFLADSPVFSVDLLAAELTLPEIDGNELARRVKSSHPEVPVLLYSYTVKEWNCDLCADRFLPIGANSNVEFREAVRLMVMKRRGPRIWLPAEMRRERAA